MFTQTEKGEISCDKYIYYIPLSLFLWVTKNQYVLMFICTMTYLTSKEFIQGYKDIYSPVT